MSSESAKLGFRNSYDHEEEGGVRKVLILEIVTVVEEVDDFWGIIGTLLVRKLHCQHLMSQQGTMNGMGHRRAAAVW